jgi:hypothetical protein
MRCVDFVLASVTKKLSGFVYPLVQPWSDYQTLGHKRNVLWKLIDVDPSKGQPNTHMTHICHRELCNQ